MMTPPRKIIPRYVHFRDFDVVTEKEPPEKRQRRITKAKPMRKVVLNKVISIQDVDKNTTVPPNFGLYDVNNLLEGIAHYDAIDLSNSLMCANYVSDIFQHQYKIEVSIVACVDC